MAILNNIFGGEDSDQSSNNDSALAGVVDTATDAGINYETHSENTDEDGETTSSHDSGALGLDLNSDSLLGGASNSSSDSMSDSDDQGGVL